MANRKTTILASAAAIAVLAAVGVGLTIYGLRDADTEEAAETRDDPLQIAGAKIAIENRFPEAQLTFGQTYVRWDGEIPSVCGKVDIVEQQDSFDGQERYVFSTGALTVEEVDGTDAVNQKWSDVCE